MKRREKMTAAKAAKKQQKMEAGLISELFPKVEKISIGMKYSRTGEMEPLSRTVNFLPSSHALFRVSCLCSDCLEGGFDFNKIINSMIKARKTASKGAIDCDKCSSPECSNVAYSVAIQYFRQTPKHG